MSVKRGMWSRSSSSSSIWHSRKGQVTMFIIIGIVLLFLFAAILFVTRTTSKGRFTAEGDPILKEVPTQLQPIKVYTENCLAQIGKRGVKLLGEQGGYIYPDQVGEFSASDPTNSDGLDLEPVLIPYWHYNAQPNDEAQKTLKTLQPALHDPEGADMFSVQAQLERYVKENIDTCLNNYETFTQQGFEFSVSEVVEPIITITDSTVNLWLKREVEVAKDNSDGTLEDFYVKLPVALGKYYAVASDITGAESEFYFLETIGLELVQVYSRTDAQSLPPTTATTFDEVNTVFWQVDDVKRKFQDMLLSNVPLIRHLSSNNFYRYEYPVSDLSGLYQKTSDNMIIPLEGGDGLDISFDYFGWDVFLDINEGEQDIRPASNKFKSPLGVIPFQFTFNEFHNTYDFAYPVLVSVHDPSAFNGEGYTFSFALEANVMNNRALKQDTVEPPVRVEPSLSMVCDPDKRNSEIIRATVVDSYTNEPLDAVNIGFQIPDQDYCQMGITDIGGELAVEYPAVYGGVVDFVKDDYLTNFYPIDTYLHKEQPGIIGYAGFTGGPVVPMHKFKNINVTVRKKNLEKCMVPLKCSYVYGAVAFGLAYKDIECKNGREQCFFNGGEFKGDPVARIETESSMTNYQDYYFMNREYHLEETESAVVFLKRVASLNGEMFHDDFSTFFNAEGNTPIETRLVPGVYEVTTTLYRNEPIEIPDDDRCTSFTIASWDSEECHTIDGYSMEKFIAGQVVWDTEPSYLRITPEDLYGAEGLTLYALNQNLHQVPLTTTITHENCGGAVCGFGGCLFEACGDDDVTVPARVMEDMQLFGKMKNISQMDNVRRALEPRFT